MANKLVVYFQKPEKTCQQLTKQSLKVCSLTLSMGSSSFLASPPLSPSLHSNESIKPNKLRNPSSFTSSLFQQTHQTQQNFLSSFTFIVSFFICDSPPLHPSSTFPQTPPSHAHPFIFQQIILSSPPTNP